MLVCYNVIDQNFLSERSIYLPKYNNKNLIASSIITGIALLGSVFLTIITLLAGHPKTAFIVALSLILGTVSLYLLLKIITLALYNTKAHRPLDTITRSLGALMLMTLLYPLCFGVKFFAAGWVAFGLVTAWAVLTLLYECVFYLKYWQWVYTVSLVVWLVCLILVFTGKIFTPLFIIAIILGIFSYWWNKAQPDLLWLSCVAETLMIWTWLLGLIQLIY